MNPIPPVALVANNPSPPVVVDNQQVLPTQVQETVAPLEQHGPHAGNTLQDLEARVADALARREELHLDQHAIETLQALQTQIQESPFHWEPGAALPTPTMALAKTAIIFLPALFLYRFQMMPAAGLFVLGPMQLFTALIGGYLALGINKPVRALIEKK